MRLETERLILRTPTLRDAKDIKDNIDNLEISKWLLVIPYPYSLEDAKWYINHAIEKSKQKKKDSYGWSIELKSERKIIGGIGLSKVDLDQGTADTGYWIGEKYWRKGIITEAEKAVLDFAFNKLKLRRIQIPAFSENKASNAVAKKLGFIFEGKLRKVAKCKATGKIHDENVWGLLKEDWKKYGKRLK